MNKAEALKILGLRSSASEKDIKKRFKKLAYEKHPDRNKSEGAEDEYKKISEAYEYLKNPPPEQPAVQWPWPKTGPFQNNSIWDAFESFMRGEAFRQKKTPPNILSSIRISFKESVLGCKKKIKVDRKVKCDSCDGVGVVAVGDSCSSCNGLGTQTQVTSKGGSSVVVQTQCPDCNGKGGEREDCSDCQGEGGVESTSEFNVNIAGGVLSGQRIKLPGAGHYYQSMGIPTATDVILTVMVDKDPDIRISGNDVASTIDISLYEALKGTTKKVRTVFGEKDLEIKSGVKHKDILKIEKCGVEGKGDHCFLINLVYPKDVSKILEVLKEES